MVRLYALLFVVQIVLAVLALISCLSAEEDEIRSLPRMIWVLIILLFPLVGSIAWFFAGRPVRNGTTGGGLLASGGAGGGRNRNRPLAPDDDPEFLRSLNNRITPRDDRRNPPPRPTDAAPDPGPDREQPRRPAGEPPREQDRPET